MKLEILISTMNRKSISDLKLNEKNIFKDCTIINQVTDENLDLVNEEIKEKNIKMISYREKGLSKSRNRALENARGEICLIADDDLIIKKEYIDNILKAFEKNNGYDIITFQSELPEGGLRKKYSKREYKHNIYTITKVSSIEIAFKKEKIKQKKIKFDARFGCGSLFPAGEETIFLYDCYKQGLKIKYIPLVNSCHEAESTGSRINREIKEETLIFKGALARRLYPKTYMFIIILIFLKLFIKGKIEFRNFKYLLIGAKK